MPKCECCHREFEENELQEYCVNYGDDLGTMTEQWCEECIDNEKRGESYDNN